MTFEVLILQQQRQELRHHGKLWFEAEGVEPQERFQGRHQLGRSSSGPDRWQNQEGVLGADEFQAGRITFRSYRNR